MNEQQTIEQDPKQDTAKLEELKQKLAVFFTRYASIAEQSIKKVRFMLIISMLTACWLSYYVMQLFHLSIISVMPLLLILGLPVLLTFKLYLALKDVIALPDQIQQIMENVKGKAITLKSGIIDQLPEASDMKLERSKLKNLFSMSKSLLDIKQIAGDALEMSSGFASALILASPLFMIFIVISAAMIGFFALLSLITGLFFIF